MKYGKIFRFLGIVCLLAVLSTLRVNAQDIAFEAAVNKTQMSYEDVLVLSFTISGGNIDLNVTPELPDLKENFDILRGPNRSTSVSIVNGKYSSSLSLQYLLSPKKTGMLEIASATLHYDNKTYTTEAITIEVIKGAPAPSQAPSQENPSQPQGDRQATTAQPEIFVRAEVDKETAYIGEQITISFYLYTQIQLYRYSITQTPNFSGFWKEELVKPPDRFVYQRQIIDGVEYGVALLNKVALFPALSGEVTIDPMVVGFLIKMRTRARNPFSDPFFGRTEEIIRKTQAIVLNILPLPEENRPDTFNGDVGDFSMSVEVSPKDVRQDEPMTLSVKIQGVGNIKTLKEPVIMLPDAFKRYDSEITEHPYTMQEPVQGEKTFESVIIPSSDGEYQLPPIRFSYFDPQRQAYQTIRSQPISLTILPGAEQDEPMERRITTKEEIKLLDKDIHFIKTDISQLKEQGRYWYQNRVFQALHVLPILAIFAAYGFKRYRDKYINDERYVRRKRANKLSKKRLKTAYALMTQDKTKEFYAAISSILRQYIGDKLNRSAAGITGDDICQVLRQHGLEHETAQLLQECLHTCDFARFAPIGAHKNEMNTMIAHAETIIDRIESLKGLKTSPKMQPAKFLLVFILVPLFCLSFSLLSCFAETSNEQLFQQGNTFYEQGKYAEAIESYQRITSSGLENGYVYYNLGSALLKEKRIGEAILAYERARRFLPRDEHVAFNLDFARALTLDKMEQHTGGGLTKMVNSIRDYFTPNELSLFFGILYLFLTFFLISLIFAPRDWKKRTISCSVFAAFLLLCSGSLLLSQIFHRSADEAILLASKSEAKTGPGEAYTTVFEIHEGAKVRIQREKLDWAEIQLPNRVIGWLMKKDLERIYKSSDK